jgi:hypothetical protein
MGTLLRGRGQTDTEGRDPMELKTVKPAPPAGWIVGVLATPEGEDAPARFYFAVGKPDQQRAEWAAVDHALRLGPVAMSPVRGEEPVLAITPVAVARARALGLADGEVRDLGRRLPRRWLS